MSTKHRTTFWSRFCRLLPLLAVAVILLLPLGFVELRPGWQTLLGTIGSAFIVVFLLGITVDWWLKKSIIEDVFRIAIGHMLPDELKPEMEWVYRQSVVAIQHTQICRFVALDDERVALRITVNRKLRNVSQAPVEVPPHIAIDEWFHKAWHSQIVEIGYIAPDGRQSLSGADIDCTKGEFDLRAELNTVSLAPNGEMEVWFEYEEIKRFNDDHVISFHYATSNPMVTIVPCNGMDASVHFAHRERKPSITRGKWTYSLPGTLLPGQHIRLRWWKIVDSERWQAGDRQEGAGESEDN